MSDDSEEKTFCILCLDLDKSGEICGLMKNDLEGIIQLLKCLLYLELC